jgi:hypothetical protein
MLQERLRSCLITDAAPASKLDLEIVNAIQPVLLTESVYEIWNSLAAWCTRIRSGIMVSSQSFTLKG